MSMCDESNKCSHLKCAHFVWVNGLGLCVALILSLISNRTVSFVWMRTNGFRCSCFFVGCKREQQLKVLFPEKGPDADAFYLYFDHVRGIVVFYSFHCTVRALTVHWKYRVILRIFWVISFVKTSFNFRSISFFCFQHGINIHVCVFE